MKKKILIIGLYLPYPLSSGGHQAFFNSIDVLRYDADIHLLFIETRHNKANQDILKKLWPEVKFHPYAISKRKFKDKNDFLTRLENKTLYFFQTHSKLGVEFSTCVRNYSIHFLDYINGIITNNSINIVQIEFIPRLSLVAALPKTVKTVFVHHELRFSRHELILREQNLINSTYYKYKYNSLKTEELALLSLYDAIITLSDIDAQKLEIEGIPAQKIHSSFAIVRSDNTIRDDKYYIDALSFVGPENHKPNKIGMEWFLDNCWSAILKKDNQLRLKIIGKWSAKTQKLWQHKYKNIEFLGFVENLYEVLVDTIMIVPITVGSGIRMKILEAATMKIPFITTEVGVEGLPFEDGEDCFISNDILEFANKILKLKNDSILQKQFIRSANEKIKILYSPEKLRQTRMAVYNSILLDNH